MVREGVGLGGVIVLDGHTLNPHGERSLGVVDGTTSPVNSTLAIVGVTTSPDANADIHRSLGEAGTTLSIGFVESTDFLVVDQPDNLSWGPLDGVSVENILGSSDVGPSVTVIGGGITLSEVVGLNLGVVATECFLGRGLVMYPENPSWVVYTYPINFIQSVRFQNDGADDTLTGSSLHLHGDFSVPEVELASNSRGIALLSEFKLGAIGADVDLASGSLPLIEGIGLGEVEVESRLGRALIGGAV